MYVKQFTNKSRNVTDCSSIPCATLKTQLEDVLDKTATTNSTYLQQWESNFDMKQWTVKYDVFGPFWKSY